MFNNRLCEVIALATYDNLELAEAQTLSISPFREGLWGHSSERPIVNPVTILDG